VVGFIYLIVGTENLMYRIAIRLRRLVVDMMPMADPLFESKVFAGSRALIMSVATSRYR